MKSTRIIILGFALLFIVASCKQQQTEEILVNKLETVQIEQGQNFVDLSNFDFNIYFDQHNLNQTVRGTTSTESVYTNDMESLEVDGSSTIHRNHKKATFNFNASDAPNLDVSGHACTLWTLVWNSADEAFSGLPPYAMYRIGGNVVGGSNQLNISGTIQEGQEADYYYTGPGSSTLIDAETAFFVTIAKSHGMMNPDTMPAQILTFGGGCDDDPDGGGPLAPCSEYVYSLHF